MFLRGVNSGECSFYKKITAYIIDSYLLMLLSCSDSNQDKQDQNLLCYHYTTGQFVSAKV